jgi:hypothetical protein
MTLVRLQLKAAADDAADPLWRDLSVVVFGVPFGEELGDLSN